MTTGRSALDRRWAGLVLVVGLGSLVLAGVTPGPVSPELLLSLPVYLVLLAGAYRPLRVRLEYAVALIAVALICAGVALSMGLVVATLGGVVFAVVVAWDVSSDRGILRR